MGERQFLFYTGADFFRQFEMAMDVFRRDWPRDVYAPRPMDPTPNTNQTRNYALYDQACDFAERLAFAEAEKLFDVLVRRNDREFGAAAAEWLELLRRYNELIEMDALPRLRFHFKSRWLEYRSLFPKDFLDEMFDPKGLAGKTNGSPDDEEDITATNSDVDLKIADYAALFPENILQEVLDPKEFTNTISASPDDTEGMTVEESLERSKSQPNRGAELKVADYTDSTPLTLVLAEEYYNSGNNYYMKHKYNQAITDYTDAIQLNPQYAEAYNNRGNSYYHKDEYDRAIMDYTDAIRLNPQYAEAYNNRGNSYYHKGEYDQAIMDYTDAIRLDPQYGIAYSNRGNVYNYIKRDYDRAIADYDRALEIDPYNFLTDNNRKLAIEAKKKQGQ